MNNMKDSTKAKIDAMSIHELEADVKNARTSPFQKSDKRRYIDERLSYLKLEQEKALRALGGNNADVVDIKPNFFGLGVNFNEVWRTLKKWRSK
jgi:hypothetical protein